MSEEVTNILAIAFGALLFLGGVIGVCAASGYYSNLQKLECIERMMDKSATDILAVCGKISS